MTDKVKTNRIIFCCVDLETFGTGQKAFVYQAGMATVEYTRTAPEDTGAWHESNRTYSYWDWLRPYSRLTEQQEKQLPKGTITPDTMAFHMPGKVTPDIWNAYETTSLYTFVNILPGQLVRSTPGTKVFYIGQNIEFDWPKLLTALGPTYTDLYTFRNTIDLRTLENVGLISGVQDKSHIAIEDAKQELEIFTALWEAGKINLKL